ncbi:MAG: ASCH domain-containing protein [Dehalococcoidia bacterium]|nr:ASCH domain-containing protein [Dehalococcoidia bacterium]
MLALSFKQPWAWLVAAGIKDVENRTWWLHLPPGRIYIHASKTLDDAHWEFIRDRVTEELWKQIWTMDFIDSLPRGAIVGEIDIVGQICNKPPSREDEALLSNQPSKSSMGDKMFEAEYYKNKISPWFTGPYGLVLKNAILYDNPVPFKGHQRFFKIEGLVERLPR